MFSSPEKTTAATTLRTPVAPGGWGWTPGGKKKGMEMGESWKGKEREEVVVVEEKVEEEKKKQVKRVVQQQQQSEEETVWRVRRGGRAMSGKEER